tara:strand:- start:192 stop:878 length:687 start_codon:yes stop_codon:yes gene_type:complete
MSKLAKLYKTAKKTGAALDKAVKKTKSKSAVDPAVSKEFEANTLAQIKKMNADVARDVDKKLTKTETKLILNPTLARRRAKIQEKNRTVSSDPRKPKNARDKSKGTRPITKVKGKGRKPTRGELDSRITKEVLGVGAATVALPAIGIGVVDSKLKKSKKEAAKKDGKKTYKFRNATYNTETDREVKPVKKNMGGMMKKKGYAKGGAVRKQSKPRGVGAATRGYGKAMR